MINKDLSNQESEEQLIGIILVKPERLKSIKSLIDSQDFFDPALRTIYNCMLYLEANNKPIDVVSISEQLKFDNLLENVGGRPRINELAEGVISTVQYKQLCKIISKYSKKRRLLSISDEIQTSLADNIDVDDVSKKASRELTSLLYNKTSTNLNTLISGVDDVLNEIDVVLSSDNRIFGLPTGFYELDKMISGLCKSKLYILAARPRVGKALGLDTNILTPTGWVKNRDIKLGDTVIGRDGKPTKVVGVYPQGTTNNYTLTLKDGRTIDCCEDHEWTVYSSRWGREKTLTTKELYNKLQCVRYKNRISLPKFTGDYGIEKDFIIPPYVMGVLIGDGCLTRGMCYCKPNITILNKVQSLLPNSDVHFESDNRMVYITNFIEGLNYIRKIGLNTQSYNKFIPNEYFHSSKEQRQELFKGLMDTDGYRFNNGWEYSTTSKQLASDVQQLAWSLGYCAKIITRKGKYKKGNQVITTRLNYRVYITSSKPLTIVDIQPTKSFETQCIHVDNKDHLFVIEDYIVTHNSAMAQQIAENVSQTHRVLFHSLEMKSSQYTKRSIFRRAGINTELMTRGMISKDDALNKASQASEELSQLNLYIDDSTECTLATIEKNILLMNETMGGCDLVVIDYAQLMQSDNPKIWDRFDIASYNSTGLKKLANKYNIPVLLLAQLSRKVDDRADKIPILSDLKDTGNYEQDADVIMFIYRGEVYGDTTARGKADLIVAKNREGRTGTIPFVFKDSNTEFIEYKRII